MNVTEQAWDYSNKVAMRGITFGCTLKWIMEALNNDELTDTEKLDEIKRAIRINEKDIAEFIRGDE